MRAYGLYTNQADFTGLMVNIQRNIIVSISPFIEISIIEVYLLGLQMIWF